MVYRGKPSAGCENCRKAKKRCTLEQPACARCVKLRKQCSGYRDTNQLQIQDESEAVKEKATRKARQVAAAVVTESLRPPPSQLTPSRTETPFNFVTPASCRTDSSSGSEDTADLVMQDPLDLLLDYDLNSLDMLGDGKTSMDLMLAPGPCTMTFAPTADDISTSHFFNSFVSDSHWSFLITYAANGRLDPCLELAIRACGMANLVNVENTVIGYDYSRSMYIDAIGLLNEALRDPKRCKSDESLMAVTMLGYYENLVCDSRESIQSWKAHIAGATQLLKIRGKAQFKTAVGRLLFRELRTSILIHCIWDDLEPPAFLCEWEEELEEQYQDLPNIFKPADSITRICFDFASLRAKIEGKSISDAEAAEACSKIDERFIKWGVDALADGNGWRWHETEVPDTPHIWNGMVHSYAGFPAPHVWNTYRSMRILCTRTQEQLCARFNSTAAEREEQKQYFRRVRRQMTDEICAGIPPALGHAPEGVFNTPNILLSAYNSIWPIFFAGTCALERVPSQDWEAANQPGNTTLHASAASAQAAWLWGRLQWISEKVGLKWASGIAAVLRGDFSMHDDLLPDGHTKAPWVRRIEKARRGVINFTEMQDQTYEGTGERRVWIGRDTNTANTQMAWPSALGQP